MRPCSAAFRVPLKGQAAQIELSVDEDQLSRFPEPFEGPLLEAPVDQLEPVIGLAEILAHAETLAVHEAQVELSLGVSLLGRLPEPRCGLAEVQAHFFAQEAHAAQAEPLDDLLSALRYFFAFGAHEASVALGLYVG